MRLRSVMLLLAAAASLLVAGQAHAGPITVLASGNDISATLVADINSRGFAITNVAPSSLEATITANPTLAGFQSVWLGWNSTFGLSAASTADLKAFVLAGGVVFGETGLSDVLAGGPDGGQLTSGGNFNGEGVKIVAGGDPVMAGLTDAGLSNWGNSYHDSYTAIGSFTALAIDTDNGGLVVTAVERIGLGRITYTGQDPDFHEPNGLGATGPNSPKADFIVNALTPEPAGRRRPGTGHDDPARPRRRRPVRLPRPFAQGRRCLSDWLGDSPRSTRDLTTSGRRHSAAGLFLCPAD